MRPYIHDLDAVRPLQQFLLARYETTVQSFVKAPDYTYRSIMAIRRHLGGSAISYPADLREDYQKLSGLGSLPKVWTGNVRVAVVSCYV